MHAEIFAIGTELLMGELMDANSAWLAARPPALGIELRRVSLLGDHLTTLSDAMAQALQGVDLIITTGGLGPTQDDLTREAMAAALHETPTVHAEVLQTIERYFQQRGRDMPAPNIKQAHRIPSAQCLAQSLWQRPGLVGRKAGQNPRGPAWSRQKCTRCGTSRWRHPESDRHGQHHAHPHHQNDGLVRSRGRRKVSYLLRAGEPYLGIYSKADGIHLRIIARAHDTATAQTLLHPVEAAIMGQLAPYVWGYDEETPAQAVGRGLLERGATGDHGKWDGGLSGQYADGHGGQ